MRADEESSIRTVLMNIEENRIWTMEKTFLYDGNQSQGYVSSEIMEEALEQLELV